MPIDNTIYLRRRAKICLPIAEGNAPPPNYLASILKNLESFGYTFSEPLLAACRTLSLKQLTALHRELTTSLENAQGAHRLHAAMYPNFPMQVMAMRQSELYFNAILHYLTDGRYLPLSERTERLPLLYEEDLRVLDLGTLEEFEAIFTKIAASNASLSTQDKDDLTWFVQNYGDDIVRLLPDAVPQKENMAFLGGL